MEAMKDEIKVPKKKRSRDQFNEDFEKNEQAPKEQSEESRRVSEETEASSLVGNRLSRTIRDEPEKKRYRDASQEAHSEKLDSKPSVSHAIS